MFSFFPRSTSPETRGRDRGPACLGSVTALALSPHFPSPPRGALATPQLPGVSETGITSRPHRRLVAILCGVLWSWGTLVKHTSPRKLTRYSWDEADDAALQTTTHADRGFRKQQGGGEAYQEGDRNTDKQWTTTSPPPPPFPAGAPRLDLSILAFSRSAPFLHTF